MNARTVRRLVVLVSSLASATTGAPAQTVGSLGDLERAELHGLEAMPASDVRRALGADPQFQVAASPSMPLAGLVETTRKQLLLAFQRGGFPDAKVSVEAAGDASKLVIRVEEGKRLTAGGVRVVGASVSDGKRLESFLLDQEEARTKPVERFEGGLRLPTWFEQPLVGGQAWRRGEPAPCDPLAREKLMVLVRNGLARQGFFAPKTRVAIEVEADLAVLVVRIDEEGPRNTLGRILVKGALRHRPSDVTAFLGIEPGVPVDVDLLHAIRRKLWQSARFWDHRLTLIPDEDLARSTLTIELREHEKVPLLHEALGDDAQALLRCLEWIEGNVRGLLEPVVEMRGPGWRGRLVLTASGGAAFSLDAHVASGAQAAAPPADELLRRLRGVMALTPQNLQFHSAVTGQRLSCEWSGRPTILGYIRLAPELDPAARYKQEFSFGAEMVSRRATAPAATMSLLLAPICFVDLLAGDEPSEVAREGGVFTLRIGPTSCRFEEATGRLLEVLTQKGETGMRLTLETGAFAATVRALAGSSGTEPRGCTPGELVAAIVGHSLSSLVSDPAKQVAAANAIQRLLVPQANRLVDAGVSALRKSQLHVPVDPSTAPKVVWPLMHVAAVVPLVDGWWERGSWPWTLVRQSMLVVSGHGESAHRELERIHESPATGPIGCLAIALVSEGAGQAELARRFARRGLERLDRESFAVDWRTLSEGETLLTRFVATGIRSLRELSDEEVEAVSSLLGPKAGPILRWLARLETKPGEGEAGTLQATVVEAVWGLGGRELIEATLRRIAEGA